MPRSGALAKTDTELKGKTERKGKAGRNTSGTQSGKRVSYYNLYVRERGDHEQTRRQLVRAVRAGVKREEELCYLYRDLATLVAQARELGLTLGNSNSHVGRLLAEIEKLKRRTPEEQLIELILLDLKMEPGEVELEDILRSALWRFRQGKSKNYRTIHELETLKVTVSVVNTESDSSMQIDVERPDQPTKHYLFVEDKESDNWLDDLLRDLEAGDDTPRIGILISPRR